MIPTLVAVLNLGDVEAKRSAIGGFDQTVIRATTFDVEGECAAVAYGLDDGVTLVRGSAEMIDRRSPPLNAPIVPKFWPFPISLIVKLCSAPAATRPWLSSVTVVSTPEPSSVASALPIVTEFACAA